MVDASAAATVADLAEPLGRHLSGRTGGTARTLVVPTEDGVPWLAVRPLAEWGCVPVTCWTS